MESEEHVELDLGQAVVVWQVTDTEEGNLFDLVVLEISGNSLNCDALEHPEDRILLDADNLPPGAHLIICYPKELADAEQRAPEPESGTADSSESPSTGGDG